VFRTSGAGDRHDAEQCITGTATDYGLGPHKVDAPGPNAETRVP
jgi:hypothetical protein